MKQLGYIEAKQTLFLTPKLSVMDLQLLGLWWKTELVARKHQQATANIMKMVILEQLVIIAKIKLKKKVQYDRL